jgi:hypothetical protein
MILIGIMNGPRERDLGLRVAVDSPSLHTPAIGFTHSNTRALGIRQSGLKAPERGWDGGSRSGSRIGRLCIGQH